MLLSSCCIWRSINENVFSSAAIFWVVFLPEKYFKTLENCRKLVQKQWLCRLKLFIPVLLNPKFLFIWASESNVYLENPKEGPETAQSLTDVNKPVPLWHISAAEYAMHGKLWLLFWAVWSCQRALLWFYTGVIELGCCTDSLVVT